jgi:hypothetical protein
MGPGGRTNSGSVDTHLIQVFETAPNDEVMERVEDFKKFIMIDVGE